MVGTDRTITTDGLIVKVKPDDIILMCSDGLSTMLQDDEILNIARAKNFTIEQRVDMLINTANNCGGKDNISAIIIDI